jgi:predicted phage terminase large subunit-like protein
MTNELPNSSPTQSLKLSPAQAAQELLRRRKAKRGLIPFTEYTFQQYVEAAHHTLIAEHLEAVERGDIDRLMINMPPRHGKSELASRRFPAWYLGKHPEHSIIAASYNSDLATDFGRQVRNILQTDEYKALFATSLADDSRAANRWNTKEGGAYVAAGVGTAITGRGANILLIDDPLKDREEADSELHRQKVWDWYTSTAYTRLAPGGRIIVIQCMSGDTPVLMATGEEKPLRCVLPGDKIATYDKGKVSTSFVRNWSNNGPDRVYKIRMKSGITVKANARHPFLVATDGGEQWVRTSALKRGDTILRVIGANGAALNASSKGAVSRPNARECATRTMGSTVGVPVIDRLRSILAHGATHISSIATGLAWQSMNAFWPNRAEFAPYAGSLLVPVTRVPIGITSSALTTVTTARGLEDCSATTATWQSATARQPTCSKLPRDTYGIVKDEVVEVVEAGVEDVFDIQVDRTENFIANGLVSHNTRWHEDDLSGKLLSEQERGGDHWTRLELPAISADGTALWPEFYPVESLERFRRVLPPRDWSALYQQRPTPEEGDYFKREWFKFYDRLPNHLRMYGASDYAVTANGGDYTVHVVCGVDPDDNLYVVDVWRRQAESHIWVEEFINLVQQHKPLNWGEENGQIVKSLGPFIDKRMRERRIYCRREQMASVADKPTRARSFQARAAMGKVYLPHGAQWVTDLMSEMMTFPAGKHDDQIDALGLIGRMLDTMVSGRAPKAPEPPESKWNRAFMKRAQEETSGSWKAR